MTDPGVSRAAERVALACSALTAAVNDLRVEYDRHGVAAVDDAAELVGVETERVCELAGEVASLAANLRRWAPTEAGVQSLA